MKYYVYYHDDYADSGGVGVKELDDKEDAIRFIEQRMAHGEDRTIDRYTVIHGTEIEVEAVERVKSIKFKC